MKAFIGIISLFFSAVPCFAQDIKTQQAPLPEVAAEAVVAEEEDNYRNGMIPVSTFTPDVPDESEKLRLPDVDYSGRVMRYGWRYPAIGGYWGWDLHEGLNVNLGLSAFTSFGKNSFSGWSQRISGMYAHAVNDKLSFAVGGYMNNISSGRGGLRDAGITAMLNYRVDEHWEAYVYAQKSFVDNNSSFFGMRSPFYSPYYPLYDMGYFGDRIGGGIRYNFNEHTSIEVNFEWSREPNSLHRQIENRWKMPDQNDKPKL